MPPEALATNHAQNPKMWKVSAKMAVPMRKTTKPIILNLMKRKIHFNDFSPKVSLTGLDIFITLKSMLHNTQSHQPYLSNQSSFFPLKNYKRADRLIKKFRNG